MCVLVWCSCASPLLTIDHYCLYSSSPGWAFVLVYFFFSCVSCSSLIETETDNETDVQADTQAVLAAVSYQLKADHCCL